ncbi:serine/threonine-protein kinase [Nocardia acidivorans]|uniref:serine/threonine-protein kinase n=1 Tax=Nocardia acidivorans TaxID=404580 RepID=UPI0008338E39|nr:serine/threonine-protein kinase [Nocardia acidivorans]
MDIAAGTAFAGYRIERVLGSGGMGTVYLVQHPRLPRYDALKVLAAERSGGALFRSSFLREGEIAARVRHPNLVAVHDRGEYGGRLWIAMQYVAGVNLAEVIRRGPLSPERIVHVLTEAARGLDELHRAGLLHRDVKPANILIDEQPGRPDRVLVTDFGIASAAEESAVIAAGGFTGTLAYAAPEQLDDEPFDHRVDVYALGCTLFQMLTGSLPFPRDTPGSLIYAHMHEDPPPPSSLNPSLPKGFDRVIAKAMAKEREDRYSNCGELAAAAATALAGAMDEPTAPKSGITPRLHGPGVRRRVKVLAALAISVVAVGAGVAAVRTLSGDSAPGVPVSNRPVTGTIDPAYWSGYAYMAQTFPELLPPTPYGSGYQELTGCIPIIGGDDKSWTTPVAEGQLYCLGNSDPVYSVFVSCNADRSPISPDFGIARAEGDERWSRASGSGHLFWGTGRLRGSNTILDDQSVGVLDVYFDEPSRNFCRLAVYGNTASGAELRAGWWPNAPI